MSSLLDIFIDRKKNFIVMSIEKKTYAEVDIIRLQVIAVKKYLLMEKKHLSNKTN